MFVAVPDVILFPCVAAGRVMLQVLDSDGEIERQRCVVFTQSEKNNWEKDEHLII